MMRKCQICSFKQEIQSESCAVFHKHFSAKQIRIWAGAEGKLRKYYCPTCNEDGKPGKIHMINPTDRLKVVLSTSTLHDFHRRGGYTGDSIHIDYNTIPGATIQTLERAWMIEYGQTQTPMDILLVAGLNNVCRGENTPQIMQRIKKLASMIEIQSQKFHPNRPSTFQVTTLLYPPRLAKFPHHLHTHRPQANKLQMLVELNRAITDFNDEAVKTLKTTIDNITHQRANRWPTPPPIHKYGLHMNSIMLPDGTEITEKSHNWDLWRQSEPHNMMLHLEDIERAKMGRAIENYFIEQTQLTKSIYIHQYDQ